MDPLTLAAIMAGTGLLKSYAVDAPKEDRQRQLAAQTQRYSPWTGMQAGAINEADPFGSAIQGAATGASMGQNSQMYQDDLETKKAYRDYLNRQNKVSPAGSMDAYKQQFGGGFTPYNGMS